MEYTCGIRIMYSSYEPISYGYSYLQNKFSDLKRCVVVLKRSIIKFKQNIKRQAWSESFRIIYCWNEFRQE